MFTAGIEDARTGEPIARHDFRVRVTEAVSISRRKHHHFRINHLDECIAGRSLAAMMGRRQDRTAQRVAVVNCQLTFARALNIPGQQYAVPAHSNLQHAGIVIVRGGLGKRAQELEFDLVPVPSLELVTGIYCHRRPQADITAGDGPKLHVFH